ncbi:MAG: OB-fold nucleic acid binding domain-containing protein [Nanoarchaeota archaeon]|nr:hypothetical protein [Nanoarchaeota archaeon]
MNLLKISLAVSFLGILILIFISSLEPKLTKISELNKTKIDSLIKIQGNIINSKKINQDFFILTINDNSGQIEILLNKNFSTNKQIEIIGKLEQYQNKFQIQVEKIEEK